MKSSLIFLLLPLFCQAQMHLQKDTLYINDSVKLVKGQSLNFGAGSNMATREFNFIKTKPSILMTQSINLPASWMGKKMLIKDFKMLKSKKTGDKYYVILGGGNIVNYYCDIESAIAMKEVVLTK